MPQLALASHAAQVGRGQLRQHALFTLESERAIVLLGAIGVPRLWGYALDAARLGFDEGFVRPHDGRMSGRLHQALEGAQRQLRSRVDALIERRTPDVALLAVALEPERIQVLCAGPGRVYLARDGELRRLTPREDRAEGLLKAGAAFCSENTLKGDLVIGGSLTAFVEASRGSLMEQLGHDGRPSLERLVETLNAKAVKNGLGVGSFALQL